MMMENTYIVLAVTVLLAGIWLCDRYGLWWGSESVRTSGQLHEARLVFDTTTGLYKLDIPDQS